ncbi:hypothetical protein EHQ16_18265 [Leptospira kanakyensis]|uniref:Uncharacterized protein n=1 Tax=Leptospira kanakyensis TaxID=2484968 RepID=A0A6N4QBN4_9LEPT|nr:hypothetical protein [Leptospira kanakyensis]TGK53978.1 hypothetical protein EHQ11_06575 [Leptospira kanakyensis]TGK57773.1 hypothetical protein EHQ16_18265 [Leptospira kanakyensis]TGK73482.1 hypothetical protein EHQ18_06650 [Leptospira kanakyensis]
MSLAITYSFVITAMIGIQDISSLVFNHSLSFAKYSLFLNLLLYFLMNGAQIFETLIFVPRWANRNHPNFQILNTEIKSANLKYFWILFHSVHEIIFLISLLFCFPIEGIGNYLISLFFLHMAVRVWTVIYFAGKIIRFQSLANSLSELSSEIPGEIRKWVFLNYIRVFIYIGISISMIPLVLKILTING